MRVFRILCLLGLAAWAFSSFLPDRLIQISIGLEPGDHTLLEHALSTVSDPRSTGYGKYLSRDEARELLRPSSETSEAVKRWLAAAGVQGRHVTDQGQFIDVRLSMRQARRLLGPHHHALARDGDKGVKTTEESLPPEVRGHVATIYRSLDDKVRVGPDARRPGLRNAPRDVNTAEDCEYQVTPECLKKTYHLADVTAGGGLAIAGFLGQAAQHDQLQQFEKAFAPHALGTDFTVELVNGGWNPQGNVSSGEANLDIQYAVAMAHNVRYYAVGGVNRDFKPDLDMPTWIPEFENATIEPYVEFARALVDTPDDQLPAVVSISYGVNEQILPRAYARQVCDMFGALGARGVSIVVASGDSGPGSSCQSLDGGRKFLPVFPATCPYVTSVGATEGSPESAAAFSSGGFSEYFPRPGWQDDAVGEWIARYGDEWKGYYDAKGRGVPDVAALGSGYQIFNHGSLESADGTSASAPVFASIIAVLNESRKRRGKPTLGFLNPWLYSLRKGFTDITEGGSRGCTGRSLVGVTSPEMAHAGWEAVDGWDPVTGLGTPLFDELVAST